MKYIRTKDGIIYENALQMIDKNWQVKTKSGRYIKVSNNLIIKQADTIEELCDCFIKIKRKKGCKPFILKHDFRDLSLLREQKIKYPESDVYGTIHVEDKGLIYVAKMNDKGELELI